MTASVSTPELARDDVVASPEVSGSTEVAGTARPRPTPGRLWAVAGLAAGLLSAGADFYVDLSGNPVYDTTIGPDPEGSLARLAVMSTPLSVFHLLATAASLLLVVFAAGLHRRLRADAPAGSLVPVIASGGLLITAAVAMMGTALDTEVNFGASHQNLDAGTAVFYSHWIGTVPYVWTGVGLTALAVVVAAFRLRVLPRWFGVIGIFFGGLTLIAGLSPLQYLAGLTGAVWMMITALGLLIGDRAHRQGR